MKNRQVFFLLATDAKYGMDAGSYERTLFLHHLKVAQCHLTPIRLNRLISENVAPKFDLTWFQYIAGRVASIFLEITGSSAETVSLFSTKARMPGALVSALP